jgi:hypothetical protein
MWRSALRRLPPLIGRAGLVYEVENIKPVLVDRISLEALIAKRRSGDEDGSTQVDRSIRLPRCSLTEVSGCLGLLLRYVYRLSGAGHNQD